MSLPLGGSVPIVAAASSSVGAMDSRGADARTVVRFARSAGFEGLGSAAGVKRSGVCPVLEL